MARLQILELPSEEDGNERFVTPFALIIDQYDIDDHGDPFGLHQFAEKCGARAVGVFSGTIDIDRPASTNIGTVSVKVLPELDVFREQIESAATEVEERLREAARARFT